MVITSGCSIILADIRAWVRRVPPAVLHFAWAISSQQLHGACLHMNASVANRARPAASRARRSRPKPCPSSSKHPRTFPVIRLDLTFNLTHIESWSSKESRPGLGQGLEGPTTGGDRSRTCILSVLATTDYPCLEPISLLTSHSKPPPVSSRAAQMHAPTRPQLLSAYVSVGAESSSPRG